ncbi:MAG: helix-turn-helix transcriptional regulator [Rhodomicrobium sp.]|nr:helix-turn-helix transcriptional regulator [Rhodomicrobium sp.]
MPALAVPAFTNERDLFLYALLVELQRLHRACERLTSLYCESMATSAALYIVRRYGVGDHAGSSAGNALLGWRLRRVKEFIAANLHDHELRLEDVARCVGLSTGFFHRAFNDTTGLTPLAYIQRQRIERAMQLLNNRDLSITNIAIGVGFLSPSHFARLFRKQTGLTPSEYRSGRR